MAVHASWLEMGASKERYQKDDQEKEAVHYAREITSRIKRPYGVMRKTKP